MRIFTTVLLVLATLGSTYAQSPTTPVRPNIPNADLLAATRLVEDYFNNLETLQANFTQTQTDNPRVVAAGVFSLNRGKGQFLWQYQTPIRQRIVGTGTAVYYLDQSATRGDNQVTQLPLDAGLGRLLRGQRLNLSKVGLRVNGIKALNDTRTVSLAALPQQRDAQGLRRVVLSFSNVPNLPTLTGFAATDTLGVTTQVSFTKPVRGVAFAKGFFDYTPPQLRQR